MKSFTQYSCIAVMLWYVPCTIFSQAPGLGAAGCFTLFTTTGAVSNTATSDVTGDVGANTGDITGFRNVKGYIYNTDSLTHQASIDLQKAYDTLYAMTATADHIPVLGGGETLYPGVYNIAAAGSALTDLYLDGAGDTSALFVFKFGGAFTTAAMTAIHLANGALAENIFWVAEGAISMGAGTVISGNLIAHNGAVGMGAGGAVSGRMLSTTGAISIYGSHAYISVGCPRPPLIVLPVSLLSFVADCDGRSISLHWSTASEVNNSYFTLERSTDAIQWLQIAIIPGAGNSSTTLHYSTDDKMQNAETVYYRLKETDFDNQCYYSSTISVSDCEKPGPNNARIYPNPTTGPISLIPQDGAGEVSGIEIFNVMGEQVNASTGLQSHFDLTSNEPGIYFVNIHQQSASTIQKIVLER